MEELSRVKKYYDYRRKIENMDLYSFYEAKEEQSTQLTNQQRSDMFNYDHMKKNTLSVSLDELLEKQESNEMIRNKTNEIVKKKVKPVKKEIDKKKLIFICLISSLILIILILVIVIAVIKI